MSESFPIQTDQDGRNYRILRGITLIGKGSHPLGSKVTEKFSGKDRDILETKIYELTKKEVEKNKLLITVSGQDFAHCIYLGWRGLDQSVNRRNFFDYVVGYTMEASKNKIYKMTVKFYEAATG